MESLIVLGIALVLLFTGRKRPHGKPVHIVTVYVREIGGTHHGRNHPTEILTESEGLELWNDDTGEIYVRLVALPGDAVALTIFTPETTDKQRTEARGWAPK